MKQTEMIGMFLDIMRGSFDKGYRMALSEMNVMSSNEEVDKAVDAAYDRWCMNAAFTEEPLHPRK